MTALHTLGILSTSFTRKSPGMHFQMSWRTSHICWELVGWKGNDKMIKTIKKNPWMSRCVQTFDWYFTLVPYCKQDACFGIFAFNTGCFIFTLSFRLVLLSNCNVVDPSSVLLSQSLNSVTVLKSPLASLWNHWAVSIRSSNWVRKGPCIFVVTGCIDTPSKV